MNIIINGKEKEVINNSNVHSLLTTLGIEPGAIIIEKNLTFLDKKDYKNNILKNGDKLEIIRFMGGG